jgi:hypothetical protein
MNSPPLPPTTTGTQTSRPTGDLARRIRRTARTASRALLSAVSALLLVTENPGMAFAADTDPINDVIANIRLTIMAVIAGYATLCLTIGLLRYTSGEPGEVERGKAGIRNAIIGYVGALLSPAIVTIVAGWVA